MSKLSLPRRKELVEKCKFIAEKLALCNSPYFTDEKSFIKLQREVTEFGFNIHCAYCPRTKKYGFNFSLNQSDSGSLIYDTHYQGAYVDALYKYLKNKGQ